MTVEAEARESAAELRVVTVSKSFGATRALAEVSFDVPAGSIHALLGGNGSGKSTLIKILAGVHRADEGTIEVGRRSWDATAATPELSHHAGLRFVHQQSSMFPDLSVEENLHIGRGFELGHGHRIKWRAVRSRTEVILERFQINARPDQLVGELRRSTQAMLAIARALQDQEVATREVLILDEPTSALPAVEVDLLFAALQRYAAAGQTILFVTHRLNEVAEIADGATVLRDGRLIATIGHDAISESRLVELMVGHALDHTHSRHTIRPPASSDAPVLTCEGLSVGALRSVSFSLRRGEILGVAGLLGSGRSTLLRTLFGLRRPTAGQIALEGMPLALKSVQHAIAAGFAFVPEDRTSEAAFAELTVAENLSMPVIRRYWVRGVYRHTRERGVARDALATYKVKATSEQQRFGALSGGNQQKVILARWLQCEPTILLLDEPTQGVDLAARLELHDLIRAATKRGTSVLVVSSEFEELEQLCDRVLILRLGAITADLEGAEITAEHLEQLAHKAAAA
jgi:ribose transport system ATP-binding protein